MHRMSLFKFRKSQTCRELRFRGNKILRYSIKSPKHKTFRQQSMNKEKIMQLLHNLMHLNLKCAER